MTINLTSFIGHETNSPDLELIKKLPLDQVEKLWNVTQIKSISNHMNSHELKVKEKCLEALEFGYHKPWDENSNTMSVLRLCTLYTNVVFFKLIRMRLDLIECSSNVIEAERLIKQLLSEFEMTCPFIPKIQRNRALELKADFVVFKLKDRIKNGKMDLDQVIAELTDVLIDHKKKAISIDRCGCKILEILRQNRSLGVTKQIEALLPECEELNGFHVDLLNVATELTLDLAIQSRKTIKFSEFITEAIHLNVRSLGLRPNVMGYFEFLKLTKLQDPRDFDQAIETCLLSIKNQVPPNEDVRGKLQIVRLIANETGDLKKSLEYSESFFSNCDISLFGSMIFEDLLRLIDEVPSSKSVKDLLEQLLSQFHDRLLTCEKLQISVQECLLKMAEKNFTVNENVQRTMEFLEMAQNLNISTGRVSSKMIKCLLKLDKLNEAEELLEEINDNQDTDVVLMKLDHALRSQNEFKAAEQLEMLRQDSSVRVEHLLSIFNSLKPRLTLEIQMNLLQTAKSKLNARSGCDMKIDILRAIVSILYEGIIESGLEPFKEELGKQLKELSEDGMNLSNNQRIWICQVCWNLGVVHARAEDYLNGQFGFKWSYHFASGGVNDDSEIEEFAFKSGFYYLTAMMCTPEDQEIGDDDLSVLEYCKTVSKNHKDFEIQLKCLEIEILLRTHEWDKLSNFLERCELSFETIGELVLKATENVPLSIYRLILEKLTEDEFNSKDFDIVRFSELFRGLTSCALLQFPSDLSHFEKAVKIIKTSFGGYPADEVTWLCGTCLEMGINAFENGGNFQLASEWTEMSMNLVYLIPEDCDENKMIRTSLQEAVHKFHF